MTEELKDKIRRICTYYSELGEGTAGYSLSEKQFTALFNFFEEELEVQYQVGYDEGHKNAWDERGKLDKARSNNDDK